MVNGKWKPQLRLGFFNSPRSFSAAVFSPPGEKTLADDAGLKILYTGRAYGPYPAATVLAAFRAALAGRAVGPA